MLAGCIMTGWAQENSGLITGTVTDATGAGVPGATISATSAILPKGVETQSNSFGKYILPQLPIGNYTLTVTKQGFSKLVQRNIAVKLGSQIDFNPKLAVGAVAEVVEVTDSAISLDVPLPRRPLTLAPLRLTRCPKAVIFIRCWRWRPECVRKIRMATRVSAASRLTELRVRKTLS